VQGLYAAGDTSLVARGHLSGAFVFGEIAAESATEHAAGALHRQLDPQQVETFFKKRSQRMAQKNGTVTIEEFEYKVRRLINDYIRPPKNEYKLNRALWWMERFRRELNEMVRVDDAHDLFKTYEVENIIECAILSAIASKERKESRWLPWHYRSDFPKRDDSQWLKHIVLTKGEQGSGVNVTYKDIVRMKKGN
jgi:succinate dehydrogenase/fumarate reductase flavoprotein subunit